MTPEVRGLVLPGDDVYGDSTHEDVAKQQLGNDFSNHRPYEQQDFTPEMAHQFQETKREVQPMSQFDLHEKSSTTSGHNSADLQAEILPNQFDDPVAPTSVMSFD